MISSPTTLTLGYVFCSSLADALIQAGMMLVPAGLKPLQYATVSVTDGLPAAPALPVIDEPSPMATTARNTVRTDTLRLRRSVVVTSSLSGPGAGADRGLGP